MRIGLVVPHIFMHRDILPHVIFSPAALALQLADGLVAAGHEVTLFTPGPITSTAHNTTADLRCFEEELAGRGSTYTELLKKHPFTFVTLARQVQSELIAMAYHTANKGDLDIVHVYTNEEEIALPFAALCMRPVVFTHHDPFNFLVKYKNVFPKYTQLNWISLSYAQRATMSSQTHWIANIYHGIPKDKLVPLPRPTNDYVAYLGRIIEPKGVHIAIAAIELYNATHPAHQLTLKIGGKHYAGTKKDTYWQKRIMPHIQGRVEYVGYVSPEQRQDFLGNARALLVPSIFAEPFGMVIIESLATGTPIIALDSGAIPELLSDPRTGEAVKKIYGIAGGELDEMQTAAHLSRALEQLDRFDRTACRTVFEANFTAERMITEHVAAYRQLIR